MALLAGRSELPFVDIGVAVGTFGADIGENRLDVALRASDAFVHAAQWEMSLVVIELWRVPDGLPAAQGMTTLAGNVQRPVGAARDRAPLLLGGAQAHCQQKPDADTDSKSERTRHSVST